MKTDSSKLYVSLPINVQFVHQPVSSTLLPMVRYKAAGVANRFNVNLQAHCSTTTIKNAIWCSFIEQIVF